MVALSFWMASTVEPGGDFGRVESDEPTEPLCFHKMHDSFRFVIAVVVGVLACQGTWSGAREDALGKR
jgi:hypothetical protein